MVKYLLYVLAYLHSHAQAASSFPYNQLYQFPNDTLHHIENLAVRNNSNLLLTMITEPTIYSLDVSQRNPSAELVYQFPNATSLTGIAQVLPDVFAIAVGNYSVQTRTGIPGSFSVWSLDFNYPSPRARMIASIPEASALNGMTTLQTSPGVLLIADSSLGAIWTLNVTSGEYEMTIQSPDFEPTPRFPLGINGVQNKGNRLYFTNSAKGIFGKQNVTQHGFAEGSLTIIGNSPSNLTFDDFALGNATAWMTNHPNVLSTFNSAGKQNNVLGEDTCPLLIEPTAAKFGRGTPEQECMLYVVTGGRIDSNSEIISGQVIQVKTC